MEDCRFIYVSPAEFNRISKGKLVKSFPNPVIKRIGKKDYRIVEPGEKVKVEKMKPSEYEWFLGMSYDEWAKYVKREFGDDNADVYRFWNDTFPTGLVGGVLNGRYSPYAELSRRTGYLGWRNAECFRGACLDTAIDILKWYGFDCQMING